MENRKSGGASEKRKLCPNTKTCIRKYNSELHKNGFRVGGLFPYGPDLVDFTKLNVHNRTSTNKGACDSTKNQAFLSHLEEQMVKIFTQPKLDTFNKCFTYLKSELADALPTEDLTMFQH
ncbi:unnamed protein product [Colias eurytheme]|nr:unnamed protein product [Colias eurytheme]